MIPSRRIFGLALAALLASSCGRRKEASAVPASGAAPANAAAAASASDRPDILLVTIDTLRADALGFAGNVRVRTPALDRLAAQGIVFRNAHAHNVVTLPSHVNILTGLLPYQHGVRDNSGFRVAPGTETLATLLKTRGYATGAFVGAFPLDARFGLNAGFDVYDDAYPRNRSSLDFEMPERPAGEVVASARAWWDRAAGRPRFAWVHLYDCHAPYRPPAPFAAEYAADPYLGEVAGVDAALAPLLEPFVSGSAGPALVVVTADHGEALGDHGEQTHGLFAYEATLHVPLVVWSGGARPPASGVRDDLVGHVDIAPTILEAAGAPKPAAWTGASLLATRLDARTPAPEYFESYSTAYNRGWAPLRGVIAGGLKLVDLPIPELYDLAADPKETHNLFAERPGDAGRLGRLLPEASRLDARRREAPRPEEVRALRSLGYLSGRAAAKERFGPEDDPKTLIAVDRDLHACVDLYQRGRIAEAVAVARRVVRERPTMGMGYESLAFLLRRQGATAEAIRVYRAAVGARAVGEELLTQYGLALCEAGRPVEALAVLEPLAGSADPDTGNALGIAYADAGRPADAMRAFDRVLQADPGNVEAVENMGIVRLREGNLQAAADLFRRALARDDRLPRSWNGLGVALARTGQEKPAIEAWAKAVALDPALYDALYNLGLTAGKNGMRAEARSALERFVATAPPQYRADVEKARRMLRELEGGPS